MDIVEFSNSQRNKPIAIRLGYIYNLHRSSIEKQDWRCKEYFKKKCPATIQTKGDILLRSKYIHKHSCDPDEASAHMAYSRMKEYAKSMPSEFPGQIMGNFSIPLHFYSRIVFCSPLLCTFSILLTQFRNSIVVVVFLIIFNVSSM